MKQLGSSFKMVHWTYLLYWSYQWIFYTVFVRDVTVAMLVYPTIHPGIELYYHANAIFNFGAKTKL